MKRNKNHRTCFQWYTFTGTLNNMNISNWAIAMIVRPQIINSLSLKYMNLRHLCMYRIFVSPMYFIYVFQWPFNTINHKIHCNFFLHYIIIMIVMNPTKKQDNDPNCACPMLTWGNNNHHWKQAFLLCLKKHHTLVMFASISFMCVFIMCNSDFLRKNKERRLFFWKQLLVWQKSVQKFFAHSKWTSKMSESMR